MNKPGFSLSDTEALSYAKDITVLVVDDDESLLFLTKHFLEKSGNFIVYGFSSPKEALKSSIISSCDAIVSDYQMPGMDGISFLKAVREQYDDIPFILFTIKNREEVVIEAINSGADFFIQKSTHQESQFAELVHQINQAVTKRRANQSLQDSQKYISDILNFLPDATFAIDHTGTVIVWNKAIEEMTGYPASEMLGKNKYEYAIPFYGARRPILIDLIDEPDEVIARYYSKRYRSDDSLTAETDLSHPKGNHISALVKVSRLYNKSGAIIGTIESIRDITELKKTEQNLKESEERFRGMAERSSDLIFVLNREMSALYVSPSSLPILGYKPEELVGKTAHYAADTIFSFSQPEFQKAMEKTLQGEIIENLEMILLKKDGNKIFVDVYAVPIIQNEILSGAQVSMRDITERKKIEQSLRNSKQKLKDAMDLANLVNWEYDVITDQFLFDERFYAMYGTTGEREGGHIMSSDTYAREFVHPDDRFIVKEEISKAIETIDPQYISQLEHRIIRRDGEMRYISVRFGITKNAEGITIQTHGANQDITDRKKAELAIRQVNRQLNLLSSITRHDILNMVTVLLLHLESLDMDCTEPRLCITYQKMLAATKKIQNQIEFTRVYEDLGTQEPGWQQLAGVMHEKDLPPGMRMKCYLHNISIYADPMLEKVFFNFIDNSIRHGQNVSEIEIHAIPSGTDLLITWEDNGIGIPPEEKNKIFERGFGKNTGLGMFLAREILSLTGISIIETGIYGSGVRFEIIVPKGGWRIGESN